MSSGKETPRQKMIGMMYLVLTCLLALNVSREILQGFVTINDSIENTNSSFTSNTGMMMEAFEEAIKKGHNDAKPYYAKAQEVSSLTKKTFDYVDGLKKEVKQYTEDTKGADTMKLANIEKLDDFDKPTFLLIGPDEKHPKDGKYSARELRQNMEGLAKQLSALLDNMKNTKGLILPDKDYMMLKDKLKVFTPNDNFTDKEGKKIGWEYKNFYNMPLAAVVTNLSKIQSDIKNIEAEMISTFAAASGKLAVKFNEMEACIVPQSEYVQSGTPFNANVFLTASSSDFKEDNLQFILGDVDTASGKLAEGAVVLPMERGRGKISLPTSAIGHNNIRGWIRFREGNGTYKYFKYENEYVVSNAAVAVSADQMNVFYVGIDNPISVSAAGVVSTDLGVNIKGCGGEMKPAGNGKFTVRVTSAGTCTISVFQKTPEGAKQQGGPVVFRVKKIPNPPMKVAGKVTVGTVELSPDLARNLSVIGVDNSTFEFNAPFRVKSFTMFTYVNGRMSQDFKCEGSSLSPEARAAMGKVKRGSLVYIENIKVQAPDGEREFPIIKVTVK
jgi:gliding motility-associated protein GldM